MPTFPTTQSLSFLLLNMALHGTEYLFGQSESSVLVVCPLTLVRPWPVHCRGRVGKREGFDAVQSLLSNTQNIGMLSTVF